MPDQLPPPGPEREAEIARLLGWVDVVPYPQMNSAMGRPEPTGWPSLVRVPAYSDDSAAADQLVEEMAARGFWCQYHSPFEPGMAHRAGFTPHSTTGWNGRPDFPGEGTTRPDAVSAAALIALRSAA